MAPQPAQKEKAAGQIRPPWADFVMKVIDRYGLPGVLVVYFLYKDWQFTGKLVALMTEVKDALAYLPHVLR